MRFQQTIIGTLILGLIVSLIFFFFQKGFLDVHFFRDEAKSVAEQARADAYKAEALRQQEVAARAKAEAEAEQIRRQAIEQENRRAQSASRRRGADKTSKTSGGRPPRPYSSRNR